MNKTIGFIGTGSMGGAMITGLSRIDSLSIFGFDPDRDKLDSLNKSCGLIPAESPLEVVQSCEYIFCAVKPGLLKGIVKEILPELGSLKCLVSIAAGIRLSKLISWSEHQCPAARIMPNTPALVDRGIFALCLEHELLTREQKDFLTNTVQKLGKTFVLPDKSFDLFTGLIGSGPAYVFYFMESMIEAGVLLGMDRKSASEMVRELFAGSSEMGLKLNRHIVELREMVTSPGGTTAVGLRILEKRSVRAAIMEAVEKAAQKSRKLGKD